MNRPSIDPLFQPVQIGTLKLANRIVMAPMTRSRSPGGVPGANVAEYYRLRAAGGAGLIITEGTTVPHAAASGYPAVPHCHGDEALAGWADVVNAVHAEGGKIMPQLWHVGSVRQLGHETNPTVPGIAPSAVINPGKKTATQAPQEMTEEDIADVIAAFASAARDAEKIGFDGVEIHGAHGYIIDQFFWTKTNQRTDSWGGSLRNRTRFAEEIVRAVRAAVAPDFPIVFRFSQWKMGDYHHKVAETPEQLTAWLRPLVDAGVTIFHASQRRFWEPEFEGSELNLAGWTQKLTGLPTITVGSIGLNSDFISSFGGKSPETAPVAGLIKRFTSDEFALVAVGRALISDPDWPIKMRDGRMDEIQPFSLADLKTYK